MCPIEHVQHTPVVAIDSRLYDEGPLHKGT